jgi:hypothetical protein
MIIAQASKTRIENPPVIGRFSGIQTRCQHRSSASAPTEADAFVNVPDKFAKYFSPNPGEGD